MAIAIFTLSACATQQTTEDGPGVTVVDVGTARTLLERDVAFVDLRSLAYIEGHIPGAVHLDWNQTFDEENLSRVVNKDQEVVLYCYGYGCYRSRKGSSLAVSWGFEKVYHFPGGYRAWKAQGYPIE